MNIEQLMELTETLFTKRSSLLSLWQEIADNFYPERADFTVSRSLGDEFADNLASGYPVLCRRDLGDQIGSMLRPKEKDWFHMKPSDERREDNEAKRWLEWATGVQKRAMYDRNSMFTRAAKEADHDFSAFGQAATQVRLNRYGNGLMYKSWHLRDMAWQEGEDGQLSIIVRRWKAKNIDLMRIFGDKNAQQVKDNVSKQPFGEVECYHIIVEADVYGQEAQGKPYFSIYYDKAHKTLLHELPVYNREYNIPRWQTVSGSQYAYSPATVVGLPDARLIQAMTYTLLEAGEKATNPPIVATQDAVRSDVSLYAGGLTWVDIDYDERLGSALRPLTQDLSGLPFGADMLTQQREMIMRAFFLNKLNLPQRGPEMTAYETARRVEEYIRGALPIFEPMEDEHNGGLCELTFDLMMRAGGFGPLDNIPASLRGADIDFRFESPLHDAVEAQKGHTWQQSSEILVSAAQLDPSLIAMVDAPTALRDVLEGIGTPAKWMNPESVVSEAREQHQQQAQAQQALAMAKEGTEAVANVS